MHKGQLNEANPQFIGGIGEVESQSTIILVSAVVVYGDSILLVVKVARSYSYTYICDIGVDVCMPLCFASLVTLQILANV